MKRTPQSRPLVSQLVKSSIQEILENRPSKALLDTDKPWKEAYSLAKMCIALGLLDAKITAPAAEPTDAILELDAQTFQFQCTECKNQGPRGQPKDLPFKELEDGMIALNLYVSDISADDRIEKAISKKEAAYTAHDKSELALLIYFNLWCHDDPDFGALSSKCASSGFSDIIIWGDFWENERDTPAAHFLKKGNFYQFFSLHNHGSTS